MLFSNLLLIAGWTLIFSVSVSVSDGICSNDEVENQWKENSRKYPKLIDLFRERTKGALSNGTNTLVFINWQEDVLKLTCPGVKIDGKVKEWKLNYFSEGENEATKKKADEFKEDKHTYGQIFTKAPSPLEYFATYSCLTIEGCWHHFYIVSRPSPKTTFPVQLRTGEDGSFSCWTRTRALANDKEEYLINAPLESITWKFPKDGNRSGEQPDNVKIVITNRTLKGVESIFQSEVFIKAPDERNAGTHECVIVDKFGVSSVDPSLDGIHLGNGERFKAIAYVHVRPLMYTIIPIALIIGLLLILPLLIKFCPTREDEADLEEDDTPPIKDKRMSSSGDEKNDVQT